MTAATKVAPLPHVDVDVVARVLGPFQQVADLWSAHLDGDLGLTRTRETTAQITSISGAYVNVLFAGAYGDAPWYGPDRHDITWQVQVKVGPGKPVNTRIEMSGAAFGKLDIDLPGQMLAAAHRVDADDVATLVAQVRAAVGTLADGFTWHDQLTGATATADVSLSSLRLDACTYRVRVKVEGPEQMSGAFHRVVRQPFDAPGLVSHAGAGVTPQRTGFGTRYLDHTVGMYRQWGLGSAQVGTGSFGSYVWARYGFEPNAPAGLADRLAAKLADDPDAYADPDGLGERISRLRYGHPGALADVASFGRTDGSTVHDGKRLLLDVPWVGTLTLD